MKRKAKHNWSWSFKGLNDRNIILLINLKKSLQFTNVKEETIFSYQKDIYSFMLWLQEKNIKTLEATVDNLIDYLEGLDISDARRTRILSSLNQLYRLNKRKRYCEENIVEKYRNK